MALPYWAARLLTPNYFFFLPKMISSANSQLDLVVAGERGATGARPDLAFSLRWREPSAPYLFLIAELTFLCAIPFSPLRSVRPGPDRPK